MESFLYEASHMTYRSVELEYDDVYTSIQDEFDYETGVDPFCFISDMSLSLIRSGMPTYASRPCIQCNFPIYIITPSESMVFVIDVDLTIARYLFWYKGMESWVNPECAFLLQCIQFIHAVNSQSQSLDVAYTQYVSSTVSLTTTTTTIIQQRIRTSLYNRFYNVVMGISSDILNNSIQSILTAMNIQSVWSTYTPVPFQEGDILSFYGNIQADIPYVDPFFYRMDIRLTSTPPADSIQTTEATTLLFQLQPPFSYTTSFLQSVIHSYIPSNLPSTLYSIVSSMYNVSSFRKTIHLADTYHCMYTESGSYLYEMYAIYLWARILTLLRT